MPTIDQLTAQYANFMIGPRHGPGVCRRCFNLTDGYERCYACSHTPGVLSEVVPISYSVAGEQLHHALAGYKRYPGSAGRRLGMGIAAVLRRFLSLHETCVARAAGVGSFPVVTTVPSSLRELEQGHRLREMVCELVAPVRERYEPVLRRSDLDVTPREFSPEKYVALRPFDGESILLIDDTWTTGANAQSAAAALRAAGSGPVALVVVGRHLNRDWHENDRRLRLLPVPFDWGACAVCSSAGDQVLDPAA